MATAHLSTPPHNLSWSAPTVPRYPLRSPLGPFPLAGPTYPSPPAFRSIEGKLHPGASLSAYDPVVMLEAKRAKQAAWAAVELRQDWADAGWLRAHLTVAGLRVSVSAEPATVPRMKSKLRSVGVFSPEIQDAVGMTLAGFLKANPRLPLWTGLAMVLEATGRFTPNASGAAL